jgi:sugar/nucleoside kinase (ribokinase family)
MATIPRVDLLKVNEVEVELLTGRTDPVEASRSLMELGPALCVVTMGPDGSYFRVAEGGDYVAPFRVDTVDATGCGDAFIAGMLCQLVLDANWREQLSVARMKDVLRYANAVGALTSLVQGVIPALPTAAQVDEFLAGQD